MTPLMFSKLKPGTIVKIVKIDEEIGSDTYNELKGFIGKIYKIDSIDVDEECVSIKGKDFYISEIELANIVQIEQQKFQDTFDPKELLI